jgi:hypothetical protein
LLRSPTRELELPTTLFALPITLSRWSLTWL